MNSQYGLRAYLTGVLENEAWQNDTEKSLGGFRSVNDAAGYQVIRADSAIYGISIRAGQVLTYPSRFVVKCTNDKISIKQIDDTAFGVEVTLVKDTAVVVTCSDTTQWFLVTKRITAAVYGTETIRVAACYNSACAGPNFISEDIDGHSYSIIMLKNENSVSYTELRVFGKSSHMAVQPETPQADGSVQVIADAYMAPTGINFSAAWPTNGITLSPGECIGIHIRRTFVENVDEWIDCSIEFSFKFGGNTYKQKIVGIVARGKESVARYELFISKGTEPDLEGVPQSYATSLSGLSFQLELNSTYYYEILFRNKFGLRSTHEKFITLPIGSTFTEVLLPPSNLEYCQVLPRSDGACVLAALYCALKDGENPADLWELYITTDGTTPVVGSTTPIEVALLGSGMLEYLIPATFEDTPVKAIVKVKRSSDGMMNSDSTVVSTTVSYAWPQGTRPQVSAAMQFGKRAVVSDVSDIVIDADKGILWEFDGLGWNLSVSDEIVLSLRHNKIIAYYSFGHLAQTGVGTSDALEVGQWDESAKLLWINVASTHVMCINCTSKMILCANRVAAALSDVHNRPAPTPIWPCFAHTVFNVYQAVTDNWLSVASIDGSGTLTCGVDWEDRS